MSTLRQKMDEAILAGTKILKENRVARDTEQKNLIVFAVESAESKFSETMLKVVADMESGQGLSMFRLADFFSPEHWHQISQKQKLRDALVAKFQELALAEHLSIRIKGDGQMVWVRW